MQFKAFFILLLLSSSLILNAQIIKTAKDTTEVLNRVKFPRSSATIIVSFNESMLNLNEIPSAPEAKKSLEKLLALHEKNGDNMDIDLMIDIYYAYYDQEEPNKGFPYLQKAYNFAVELYDQNPSNIDLLKQITEMMIIVNRLADVPRLWEGYTNRNPEVAEGWAQLALYKIQVIDTAAARKYLEKAYELEPKRTEIYVTALLEAMYKFILHMSELKENEDIAAMKALDIDVSFLKRAAAQHPKLEIAQMSLRTAQLLKLFYESVLTNVDKFSLDRSFKFEFTAEQKVVMADLEKYMKEALANKKIVNKFFPLKALVVLETLRSNMDMAIAYMEESKKYMPADVDMYRLLSFGYLAPRKYHKAIPYLKKACNLSPNYDDLFTLARLQFENYQYDDALTGLQSLLQSHPDKFDVIFGLVAIQFKQGKAEEACGTLMRLQELYKDEVDFTQESYFLYYKAICHLFFDEKKSEAEKAIRAAIDNDTPWMTEAKELLELFCN